MKYAADMNTSAMIYIPSFIETSSATHKLMGYTETYKQTKQTPWSESASEQYRPNDRRLSAKIVPTFADRGATCSP
jgi:hypothetical protein